MVRAVPAETDPTAPVGDAIWWLEQIDAAAEILRATAPVAAAAIVVRLRATAIGPLPDLTVEEWATLAEEHQAPRRGATSQPQKQRPPSEPRQPAGPREVPYPEIWR